MNFNSSSRVQLTVFISIQFWEEYPRVSERKIIRKKCIKNREGKLM
jgi:hypothetical protein